MCVCVFMCGSSNMDILTIKTWMMQPILTMTLNLSNRANDTFTLYDSCDLIIQTCSNKHKVVVYNIWSKKSIITCLL